MAIQWFPGHMHLTRKAITERIKDIDVVIEVLDARLPGSSSNPLLAEFTGHKPTLKVLNKQDVADPERTALWVDWYNAQSDTRALPLDASDPAPTRKLIDGCHLLAPSVAAADHILDAANIGADAGHARRHRLDQRHRGALVARGERFV